MSQIIKLKNESFNSLYDPPNYLQIISKSYIRNDYSYTNIHYSHQYTLPRTTSELIKFIAKQYRKILSKLIKLVIIKNIYN